ncbi:MAG: hypothetical protein JWN33_469 [Candidatus Saccharibacteria bacterium]|nr:hypothetical protein [Candidatus Saccharibacteria bacterium]
MTEQSSEKLNPRYEKPRPLTWAASPLQLIGRPDITEQQHQVFDALLERTASDVPFDVPKNIQDFMAVNFMTRFHERSMKNVESHDSRLKKDISDIPLDQLGVYERALNGNASPSELLWVRRTFGMRSIELSKLTHPYGKMIDLLVPMREAVTSAVLENGGKVYEPTETQKLKLLRGEMVPPSDTNEATKYAAVAMTRKRLVGEVDDDTRIYERSSFIIRVDEATHLDPEITDALNYLQLSNNSNLIQDFLTIPYISSKVFAFLDNNNFDVAIPLSTTVYAYNRNTDRKIEDSISSERASQRKDSDLVRLRRIAREEYGIALFK